MKLSSKTHRRIVSIFKSLGSDTIAAPKLKRRLAIVLLALSPGGGGGGGGGGEGDEKRELEDEINELIDLLIEVQEKAEEGSKDEHEEDAENNENRPRNKCDEIFVSYEDAVKANNSARADNLLKAYNICLGRPAGPGRKPKIPKRENP